MCKLEKEIRNFRDRKRTQTLMEDVDLDQIRISFSSKITNKFENIDQSQIKKVGFGDEIIYEFNEGNVFQSFSFVKGMAESKDESEQHKKESDSDQRSKDELAQRIESSEGHMSNLSSVTSSGLRRINMGLDDVMKSIESSSWRFKVVMVVMVSLVSAAAISCVVFLTQAVTRANSVDIFREFAHRGCLNIAMATKARQLTMMNYGYSGDEVSIKDDLTDMKANYTLIISHMKDSVEQWQDGSHKDFYLLDKVMTFSLADSRISGQKMNMFNAMSRMVDNAGIVLESALSEQRLTSPAVFYLVRNGVGETLEAVNVTNQLFLQEEDAKLEVIKMQVNMLLLAGILLLLGAFFLVIVPTIYFVEKNNRSVWIFLYELPREGLAELKLKCLERLDVVHGEDYSLQFKEEVRAVRKKNPRPSYKWRSMAIKIMLYISLSLVYFLTMWQVWTPNISGLLHMRPVLMGWVELEHFYVRASFYWTQERLLQSSPCSLYYLDPSFQLHFSVDYWLANATNSVLYISRVLLDGDDSMPQGFDDSMISMEIDNAGEGLFSQGLYSAVSVYVQNTLRTKTEADLHSLEAETNTILGLITRKIDDYETRSTSLMNENEKTATIFTSAYCVISLCLLLFLYFPLINQVKTDITEVWDMRRLIPQELLQRQMISKRNREVQSKESANHS